MKAWPLLLVAIGACAEPPRRPPVTYVPIVRAPEPPPPVLGTAASGASAPAPAEKEGGTATSLVAVSTEAPPAEELCHKRALSACCTETTIVAKKQGNKLVCPGQLVVKARCKGVGPKCK